MLGRTGSEFSQISDHVSVLSPIMSMFTRYSIYTVEHDTIHNKNWICSVHIDL